MKPHFDEHRNFKPVTKRPRREWEIPRIDAQQRALAYQKEETRLKAIAEGTTPHGREILRKILYHAEKLLSEGDHTLHEIEVIIQGHAWYFKALWPEFARLLSRIYGGDEEMWLQTSPRSFAKLVVVIAAKTSLAREVLNAAAHGEGLGIAHE